MWRFCPLILLILKFNNMKIAYVAHPIGGNVEKNLNLLKDVIWDINCSEPNTVPFAPYIADVISMDDDNPKDRAKGIKNNMHLLQFCDELRLYGNTISKGMISEIERAKELGIPIIPMNEFTEKEYINICSNAT